MCSKGNPSSTNQQQTNTSQSGSTQGQQLETGFSQLGPNPDTMALYNQFLQHIGGQGVMSAPFDPNMMQQTVPWTAGQDAASNYQIGLGMQGMPYGADAAALLNQGAQSTVGQIPGVASSLMSPWANQAVNYGQQQGQNISNYATNLAAQGPQLEQFSQAAIDRYMSPYINDVVNATQNQFTNANAQQGNVLLGQGIRAGNAFGGDRAGVAAAQLGNQQQLAQAPVIAGLYNTGYNTALGEFNTQNALAAQLGQMALQGQQAGAQLGMQGYGLGLNAAGQANALAAQALAQNQNAALQGGSMLGQLGGLTYSQNLAGGAQANQAAQIYPAYLQNLYATQAANAQMAHAYPFQTSSWYGGLLQGIGGLTGTQQQNVNAALANYLTNQQGTSLINGTATPAQPNQWMQVAGLGLAGLGLLAKRGGSVPRAPRRAVGGGIPHRAGGGNFLKGGFGAAIEPRAMQNTHLAAPNTSASRIKLPTLSLITFPGMSMPSASTGTQGSQSTLGQAGALLGNKQTQSGLKSIGNFIFGNDDTTVSSAVADTTGLGGGSPAGLPVQAGFRRGGSVPMQRFRAGGQVPAHYSVGGRTVHVRHRYNGGDTDDENYDDFAGPTQRTGATWFDTAPQGYSGKGGLWSDPSGAREGPPASGAGHTEPGIATPNRRTLGHWFQVQEPDGSWRNARQTDLGPGREPQSRGIGLDVNAPLADDMGFTPGNFPSGKQMNYRYAGPGPGLPEQANVGLPDPRDAGEQPDIPTRGLAQGEPGQDGLGPRSQEQQGSRRIDFGIPQRPQGFLERWASNPLTQFGLGLASAKGAGMTGVAEGLAMGLNQVQAQKIANDKLDQNYKLDTSGDTVRLIYPTHAIDTKLSSGRATLAAQNRGRLPEGHQLDENGRVVPIPGYEDTPDYKAKVGRAEKAGKAGKAGRVLTQSDKKFLGEAGTNIDQLETAVATFDPAIIGGYVNQLAGETAMKAGLTGYAGPERQRAAEWWQGYYRYRTDIRHSKFGASLTKEEKADWNTLDIHPGQDPDTIRRNIERQQGIIYRAAARYAKGLAAEGYSQEAIEERLGVSVEELGSRVAKASRPPAKEEGVAEGAPKPAPASPASPASPAGARPPPPSMPPSAGAAPKAKREPTQQDIDFVKAHPEKRDKFIKEFGREP